MASPEHVAGPEPEYLEATNLVRQSARELCYEGGAAHGQIEGVQVAFDPVTREVSFSDVPQTITREPAGTLKVSGTQPGGRVIKVMPLGVEGVVVTRQDTRPSVEAEGFGASIRIETFYEIPADGLPRKHIQYTRGRLNTEGVLSYEKILSPEQETSDVTLDDLNGILLELGAIRERMIPKGPDQTRLSFLSWLVSKWLG